MADEELGGNSQRGASEATPPHADDSPEMVNQPSPPEEQRVTSSTDHQPPEVADSPEEPTISSTSVSESNDGAGPSNREPPAVGLFLQSREAGGTFRAQIWKKRDEPESDTRSYQTLQGLLQGPPSIRHSEDQSASNVAALERAAADDAHPPASVTKTTARVQTGISEKIRKKATKRSIDGNNSDNSNSTIDIGNSHSSSKSILKHKPKPYLKSSSFVRGMLEAHSLLHHSEAQRPSNHTALERAAAEDQLISAIGQKTMSRVQTEISENIRKEASKRSIDGQKSDSSNSTFDVGNSHSSSKSIQKDEPESYQKHSSFLHGMLEAHSLIHHSESQSASNRTALVRAAAEDPLTSASVQKTTAHVQTGISQNIRKEASKRSIDGQKSDSSNSTFDVGNSHSSSKSIQKDEPESYQKHSPFLHGMVEAHSLIHHSESQGASNRTALVRAAAEDPLTSPSVQTGISENIHKEATKRSIDGQKSDSSNSTFDVGNSHSSYKFMLIDKPKSYLKPSILRGKLESHSLIHDTEVQSASNRAVVERAAAEYPLPSASVQKTTLVQTRISENIRKEAAKRSIDGQKSDSSNFTFDVANSHSSSKPILKNEPESYPKHSSIHREMLKFGPLIRLLKAQSASHRTSLERAAAKDPLTSSSVQKTTARVQTGISVNIRKEAAKRNMDGNKSKVSGFMFDVGNSPSQSKSILKDEPESFSKPSILRRLLEGSLIHQSEAQSASNRTVIERAATEDPLPSANVKKTTAHVQTGISEKIHKKATKRNIDGNKSNVSNSTFDVRNSPSKSILIDQPESYPKHSPFFRGMLEAHSLDHISVAQSPSNRTALEREATEDPLKFASVQTGNSEKFSKEGTTRSIDGHKFYVFNSTFDAGNSPSSKSILKHKPKPYLKSSTFVRGMLLVHSLDPQSEAQSMTNRAALERAAAEDPLTSASAQKGISEKLQKVSTNRSIVGNKSDVSGSTINVGNSPSPSKFMLIDKPKSYLKPSILRGMPETHSLFHQSEAQSASNRGVLERAETKDPFTFASDQKATARVQTGISEIIRGIDGNKSNVSNSTFDAGNSPSSKSSPKNILRNSPSQNVPIPFSTESRDVRNDFPPKLGAGFGDENSSVFTDANEKIDPENE